MVTFNNFQNIATWLKVAKLKEVITIKYMGRKLTEMLKHENIKVESLNLTWLSIRRRNLLRQRISYCERLREMFENYA